MKHLQKQLLLEQIIYATIWVLILGTPLISFLLDDDRLLEGAELWKEVSDTWLIVFPFFLLFLIHNYILIPRLLLKKYYTRYVVSLVFTIGILFLYLPECIQVLNPHPRFRPQKEFVMQDSAPRVFFPDPLPASPPGEKNDTPRPSHTPAVPVDSYYRGNLAGRI